MYIFFKFISQSALKLLRANRNLPHCCRLQLLKLLLFSRATRITEHILYNSTYTIHRQKRNEWKCFYGRVSKALVELTPGGTKVWLWQCRETKPLAHNANCCSLHTELVWGRTIILMTCYSNIFIYHFNEAFTIIFYVF